MSVPRPFAAFRSTAKQAHRPPMGWNSWDVFGTNVSEDEVLVAARVMAERLRPSGYDTVVVDLGWYAPGSSAIGEYYKRPEPHQLIDQWGRLIPDPARFPSAADGRGFKPLAERIHAMGLRFGIHVMRGIAIQAVQANTPVLGGTQRARDIVKAQDRCVFYDGHYAVDLDQPSALAYYESVLALYAEWGVDFIKADDMTSWPQHFDEVLAFRYALDRCGRPMTLSLSPGSVSYMDRSYLHQTADMFRITGDLWDSWDALKATFPACRIWKGHTGPGRWADCDMLPLGLINVRGEGGHGGRRDRFTAAERRTMMSLWAIFRSPLMLGCDLGRLDDDTAALVTNPEIIRLNQRSVGNDEIIHGPDTSVWRAEDPDTGDRWAALFNLADRTQTIEVSLAAIGSAPGCVAIDVWSGSRERIAGPVLRAEVEAHGVRCMRLTSG